MVVFVKTPSKTLLRDVLVSNEMNCIFSLDLNLPKSLTGAVALKSVYLGLTKVKNVVYFSTEKFSIFFASFYVPPFPTRKYF
jgi:hypothetical protein